MKPIPCLAATLLGALSLTAAAQTMKPGLWEISSKMQSASGEMEKAMAQAQAQMAALPPEQRKMMQDMMGKQGVNMGAGAGMGAMSIKVCMTKEMIDRNEVAAQNKGDCKQTVSPRTGNTMKMAFTCTNPPSSGEGQVTFAGPESYNVKMTVNTTQQGRTEKMNMDSTGKWLSADCGAIKPLVVPKK